MFKLDQFELSGSPRAYRDHVPKWTKVKKVTLFIGTDRSEPPRIRIDAPSRWKESTERFGHTGTRGLDTRVDQPHDGFFRGNASART